MYEPLLNRARAAVTSIREELDNGFTPEGSQYSSATVAEVRRDILSALKDSVWMTPRELADELCTHPTLLVMRELRKLANNPRSDVLWNGRSSTASQYGRRDAA
jgi:hypothetical protein